jgi:YD repeat-containing protein
MLSACQKDKQEPGTNTTLSKVKTYTESITTPGSGTIAATYNLTYDANNRITSVTQADVPGNKFVFSYTSDTKYSMDLFEAGEISVHEDIFLNSNALPDSTFQYDNDEDTTTEKYIYNSKNQLLTLKEYEYSTIYGSDIDNITTYTYDADGNVATTTDTNNQTETFEYYPDLVYAMPLTNPLLNSTKAMHLVKTHQITSNGYLVGSIVNTYTFDSNKRISTITQTLDDGTVATQTFTYF